MSELVKEGVEEHHVVGVLMNEIRQLDAGDDQFAAKMTVLIENVEHHAEEEEEELFPQLREAFEDAKSRRWAARWSRPSSATSWGRRTRTSSTRRPVSRAFLAGRT